MDMLYNNAKACFESAKYLFSLMKNGNTAYYNIICFNIRQSIKFSLKYVLQINGIKCNSIENINTLLEILIDKEVDDVIYNILKDDFFKLERYSYKQIASNHVVITELTVIRFIELVSELLIHIENTHRPSYENVINDVSDLIPDEIFNNLNFSNGDIDLDLL